jgi:DNA helicase-2/ATP-dependent DNA helicase PcrA
LSPDDFAKTSSTPIEREIANIYKEYQNYLHQNNAMDFDDLLVNTYELFYSHNEILEKYQDRFLFILVDEYQDTNRVQYLVLKQLSSKFKNITVVGDDAQSIYRWRGADIRNILEFQKDFPDAKIIRLEQNYRSTKNILGAADSVIRFNRKQIDKKLWTNNLDGDLIELIVGETDKDEANLVVSKIKELVSSNDFAYKDIAILYRTNAQSLEFENALRRSNIDYIVIGGMSFYRRKEIKDVLAYIRLLVNPNDNEAFIRIINEPPRGIGKVTLNHLINFARTNNTSIYEAMKNVENIDQIQSKSKAIISEFVKWLEITKEKMQIKNESHNALITFIDESGIIQMYEEIGTDDAYDRIENIETLLSDIYDFLKENPDLGLEDYVQQISLLSDIDEKNLTDNQVKLMTLHSAKGMEFPIVFIVGLEQGLFPLIRNRSNQDDEEEERRLFYVGLTRAMEKVFLSYAKNRQRFGMDSYQVPSKFLSEIDKKYLKITTEESRSQSYNKDWKKDNYDISYGNEYDQTENGMLKKGDKVLHPFFGVGWVEKIEGSGNNIQALVLFESVGRKRLMLQYARLRKLTD